MATWEGNAALAWGYRQFEPYFSQFRQVGFRSSHCLGPIDSLSVLLFGRSREPSQRTFTCLDLQGTQPFRDLRCGLRVFAVFVSPVGILVHHHS